MAFHINPATGNPNQCRAQAGNCPFGSAEEHYESKEDARAAYETRMAVGDKPSLVMVKHDKDETMTTGNGNTYSKVTEQPNGSLLQTVNGKLIVIGKKDAYGHKVFHNEELIGSVFYNAKAKKWEVMYADGRDARAQKWPVDAMAALLKKKYPPKKAASTEPSMPKGYDPGERSELDPYSAFPNNKAMTTGRLRRLSTRDLASLYNRLELSKHNAHYGAEIESDRKAQERVKAVLAERNHRLEIASYGGLEPGQDYGSAASYRLANPDTRPVEFQKLDPVDEHARVPCDDAHSARVARDGYCRKCGGAE